MKKTPSTNIAKSKQHINPLKLYDFVSTVWAYYERYGPSHSHPCPQTKPLGELGKSKQENQSVSRSKQKKKHLKKLYCI